MKSSLDSATVSASVSSEKTGDRGSSLPEPQKCNGWTNYETWCVNLWMSNDAGSDEYFREIAQEVYDDSTEELRSDGQTVLFTRDEVATRNLADRLKEEHEERQNELTVTGVFADLLGAALGEVDWHEIASHYIDDVDKEPEAA